MAAVSKDIRAISKVIAIVTGGASGLGQATAARLVQNGARVTIADLPTSKGDEVAKQLGNNCAFVPTNVSECCIRQKIHCSLVRQKACSTHVISSYIIYRLAFSTIHGAGKW